MFPHFNLNFTNLNAAVSVLTAMITPALLLSACGTLILSTSNRLARIVDRIRFLSNNIENLARSDMHIELREERIHHGREEMKLQSKRLRNIQWALTLLYLAVVSFLMTSVSMAFIVAARLALYAMPVVLGVFGSCCMLSAATILLLEARQAVKDLAVETEFHRYVTRQYIAKKDVNPTKELPGR